MLVINARHFVLLANTATGCIPTIIACMILDAYVQWAGPLANIIAFIAFFVCISTGITGAVMAFMYLFGTLPMGCPRCRGRGRVTDLYRGGFQLDCERCGSFKIKSSRWGFARIVPVRRR